jgi:single-stranded-DNA-specific exonuclease
MLKRPNVGFLSLHELESILSSRVDGELTKLSQIPHPSLLKDIEKASKRVVQAIQNGEKITLVGDYDVDGVVSSVITKRFFDAIGVELEVIIPNRFSDGYGVSPNILQRVNSTLVITVDNGITASQAANICKDRGIDLIITDHHTPPEILPDAYAIINPKQNDCEYPFKEICGAQVVWLFLAYLKSSLSVNVDMNQFIEFLALAIVADVMPLVEINRALVKKGLKFISTSNTPAFVVIKEFLNKNQLGSDDIGFQIAPRLNSAGRLEDASIAYNFLMAKDESEAYRYFELLDELNKLRKATEAEVSEEALLSVDTNNKILVAYQDGWNEGVVGIVASRLTNKFHRPAIVLSIHNGIAKGSARSIGDVDIYELILSQKNLLDKFGGHKMAAGLSLHVDNLDEFISGINAEAEKLDDNQFIPASGVVAKLKGNDINFSLLDLLERFEPYGEANPKPKFLIEDAKVNKITLFGSNAHSKVDIMMDNYSHQLLVFREQLSNIDSFSCSYSVNKNVYNGRTSIQMIVERIYE